MERVKTGTIYWYITIYGEVEYDYECDSVGDFKCFSSGNYFHTKEEAESMAKKLRAVLKGAEVIEMPSKEEIETEGCLSYPISVGNYEAYKMGWTRAVEWLKEQLTKEE